MKTYSIHDRSGRTAISRKDLSAPIKWICRTGYLRPREERILDYGCGRGYDCDTLGFEGWDPHHRPFPVPEWGAYDVVVCGYVLNVLQTDAEILEVIHDIQRLLSAEGPSVAYVTVRADDHALNGPTQRGTYQRAVRLRGCPVMHEVRGRWRMYVIDRSSKVEVA